MRPALDGSGEEIFLRENPSSPKRFGRVGSFSKSFSRLGETGGEFNECFIVDE